jgi:hypothetical protein
MTPRYASNDLPINDNSSSRAVEQYVYLGARLTEAVLVEHRGDSEAGVSTGSEVDTYSIFVCGRQLSFYTHIHLLARLQAALRRRTATLMGPSRRCHFP